MPPKRELWEAFLIGFSPEDIIPATLPCFYASFNATIALEDTIKA